MVNNVNKVGVYASGYFDSRNKKIRLSITLPAPKRLIEKNFKFNVTQNIAEFMAIIWALDYCEKNNIKLPIYTVSKVAKSWLLKPLNITAEIDSEIIKKVDKMRCHYEQKKVCNQVLFWETKKWGKFPSMHLK